MSQILNGALHTWQDGETVTGANMNANQTIIQAAVNDNATQVAGVVGTFYTKSEVDGKINAATAGTTSVFIGTAFPSSAVAGQLFYRTDYKALYEYDSANGWQLNMKAGNGIMIGADGTISVITASASRLGAVQVGTGLNVDANGVLSASDLLTIIHMGV